MKRFLGRGPRKVTAFESRNGYAYKTPIVPFGEIVMIKVTFDPPCLRRKLDSQWLKGAWVGRTELSDSNIVVTPHGYLTGKTVRRLSPEARAQSDIYGRLTTQVNESALSLAQIMKILPLATPRLLDGDDGDKAKVEDKDGDEKMLDKEIDTTMVQVPSDQTTVPLPITPIASAPSAAPAAAVRVTLPTQMSTPTAEDVVMELGDARATDATRTSTEAGFEDPQQVR